MVRATEGRIGRVFMLRLEDGDIIPECIEKFAAENDIMAGHCILIGGIGGGQIVSGPRNPDDAAPEPMLLPVDSAHEVLGTGIITPGDDGRPVMHIHAALGRAGHTMTGCLRPGVRTWLVGEAIIYEITGAKARRLTDKTTGFNLLEI